MYEQQPGPLARDKARLALEEMERALAEGRLSGVAELVTELARRVGRVYRSLTGSQIEVPPMQKGDLLLRSLVEEPFAGLDQDLTLGFSQLEEIRGSTKALWNLSAAERAGLSELLRQAVRAVDGVRLATAESDPTVLWVGDTFRTREQVDPEGTTAGVDTQGGLVTLGVEGLRNLNSALVEVVLDPAASQGIPGNNLEIRETGLNRNPEAQEEPKPVLWSAIEETHDVNALVDSNPATRFEWETVVAQDFQPLVRVGESLVWQGGAKPTSLLQATLGYGWRVAVKWPGSVMDDLGPEGKGYPLVHLLADRAAEVPRAAHLVLRLAFREPVPLSLIQVIPHLRTGVPVELRDVQVSADGESWVSVLPKPIFLTEELNERGVEGESLLVKNAVGTALVPVLGPGAEKGAGVRALTLVFHQDRAYTTFVGHKYYAETIQRRKDSTTLGFIHHGKTTTYTRRLPGPDRRIEVPPLRTSPLVTAAVGAAVGGSLLGWAVGGPLGALASQLPIVGDVLQSIAGFIHNTRVTETVLETQEDYDILEAQRYGIALRGIELEQRSYAERSQLVSRPLTFPRPVRSVTLMATEYVPPSFGPGPWITYEVSPDGVNWQTIAPAGADREAHFPSPTDRVLVKVTLSRPPGSPELSPVLYSYSLAAVPWDVR